ncbi:MAG: BMP family protein [Burkholderiales bacterium]
MRIAGVLFGPPGQGSFNESGMRAFESLRAEGAALDLHWIAERDPAGRADALARLCEAGLDLLVAHGGQGDAPVGTIAARFPEMRFAISQGSVQAPNVACYDVLQEHSALLAGVLAASLTKTGIVAHMSGDRVKPGLKGRAAYVQGVALGDPGVRVLTGFCGNQHDPDLAGRCVDALAAAGADMLFAMIDGGRPGAIAACRRHGIAQIGNVLDWTAREPDVFIASALADSGWGIRRAVRDFQGGRLPCGTVTMVGLEEPDVVSLKLADRVPAAARERVDAFRQRLLAGGIDVVSVYEGPEYPLPQTTS